MDDAVMTFASKMDNRVSVTPTLKVPVVQSTDGVGMALSFVHVTTASIIVYKQRQCTERSLEDIDSSSGTGSLKLHVWGSYIGCG